MTITLDGHTPITDTPDDHEVARAQALALVINALELDEQSYIARMRAIEQPYYVANQLVRLLVDAVPEPKHGLLARELRKQLDR